MSLCLQMEWCGEKRMILTAATNIVNASHIEAGIKWPSFCRRHFQEHLIWWKSSSIDSKFTEVCSQCPIDCKLSLVQVMVRRQRGYKPLSEPMMTWFTHAYITQGRSVKFGCQYNVWIFNIITVSFKSFLLPELHNLLEEKVDCMTWQALPK